MHVDGECLCGGLQYEAEVDPASTHVCHCTDCQTLAGSAFRTTVFVTGGFRFIRGEPKTFVKIADSGNRDGDRRYNSPAHPFWARSTFPERSVTRRRSTARE